MIIDISNISEILEIIPTILQYFIPGFIFLTIRSLSLSIELKNDKEAKIESKEELEN